MADRSAVLLFLLVSFSLFLLQEARPLHSSVTNENMFIVARKGSSGSGRGAGAGSSVSGGSSRGRSIPLITGGAVIPRTSSGASSHEKNHNAAHSGFSFSISALLIISAFWLESLACL